MRVLLLLLVGCLQACGTPSGPIVIPHSEASAVSYRIVPASQTIPDCQNVSTELVIWAYEPEFHHSTRGSLAIELTQSAGKAELRPDDRYEREYAYQLVLQALGLDGRTRPFEPFCMAYMASVKEVTSAVNSVLPFSDSNIDRRNERAGVISTTLSIREHSSAKWREQYSVMITPLEGGMTGVQIYRTLEMLRAGSYVRAKSDGHNEAWMLQKVARTLSN